MSCGNSKINMYKVIGGPIYTIIDNYICLDYLVLIQEKFPKHDNNFENTRFKDFSRLGIPEILMNIISCRGFSKSSVLTVILTCRSALVPYYLSKRFIIVKTEEGGVDNIPTTVKIKSKLIN